MPTPSLYSLVFEVVALSSMCCESAAFLLGDAVTALSDLTFVCLGDLKLASSFASSSSVSDSYFCKEKHCVIGINY